MQIKCTTNNRYFPPLLDVSTLLNFFCIFCVCGLFSCLEAIEISSALSEYSTGKKEISSPNLLIKIPTRSRPSQFFQVLDKYYENLSGEVPYLFLITCDVDDETMNCPEVRNRLMNYPNLDVYYSENRSKVEAYNRDINDYVDWFDILLITSDDMIPVIYGYDKIISEHMQTNFPDLDGVLNFNDGYINDILNTYPIIGKKYYQRFNYVYHPAYTSLWCDNELTVVSRILGKEAAFDDVIIYHNHPCWTGSSSDALLQHNESFFQQDKAIYEKRQAHSFDLDENTIRQNFSKVWSILICTLDERKDQFNYIYTKLQNQIKENGLENNVEILSFCDNRNFSVGHKRNALLRASKGLYTCFVDDDDDVHNEYVKMIHNKLKRNPDCVSLLGIYTVNHQNPRFFKHSIVYRSYFESNNVFYRPPNHLNPIRRSIAAQFLFPKITIGEDTDWAMQIARSGLLKTEEDIQIPYYFYNYVPK